MRRAGRKFLEFMTQKDAFLKPFSPFFLCNFRRISMRQGGAGGGGSEDPPRKFLKLHKLQKMPFSPFSSLLLSLFYFFPLTLQFHLFSPASHPPPPTIVFWKIYTPVKDLIRKRERKTERAETY